MKCFRRLLRMMALWIALDCYETGVWLKQLDAMAMTCHMVPNFPVFGGSAALLTNRTRMHPLFLRLQESNC
jgi:hypothetical protein